MLEIKYQNDSDLNPYENNARTHSAEQVEQIAASMMEFGWTNPILVDENNIIIAGHGRLEAARWLWNEGHGIEGVEPGKVPTILIGGLSEEQRKGLTLSDNQIALNSGWDMATLNLEMLALKEKDFDLSIIGFNSADLSNILGHESAEEKKDDIPDPNAYTVTTPGAVWVMGGHRLRCGDSTSPEDVAALLGEHKPNLMVTDPPYGVEYDPKWRADAGINNNDKKMGEVANDDRADWRESWALFPGNVAYVWHAGLFAGLVGESLTSCGFSLRSQIIWIKDRFALSRGDYHWQHEPCWYAVKIKSSWMGDRKQSTTWNIHSRDDSGIGHGTQKPVECMRRPIVNNSKAGDYVYDPFLGSGTTMIAAEMEGRKCVGMELSPEYCDIIVRRWQDFTGKEAILESTGEHFNVIDNRMKASHAEKEKGN